MDKVSNAISPAPLHPVFWLAGISLTLLSLAVTAALSGLLPQKSVPAPERLPIAAMAQASEPPAAIGAPTAPVTMPPASTVSAAQALPASGSTTPSAIRRKAANKKQAATEIIAGSSTVPSFLDSGVPPDYVPSASSNPVASPPCPDCGVIETVRQVTHEGQGSGAGAIIGGLAGGALASNIGRGNTRTLATIAGALGGGMLGNSIEKSQRTRLGYQVAVRMEDGATRLIDSESVPPWRIGDSVRLVGGAIVSR